MSKSISIAEYRELLGGASVGAGKPKKRHKYGAKATEVDGIQFPSTREATRYKELKLRERAGEISELKLQVPYPIEINGIHVCSYIADFTAIENGELRVYDAKGFATPDYIIKRKLMAAVHGVEIIEI